MRDLGKHNVLGVLVDAVDYEAATEKIMVAARDRRPLAVSALAVHGVMTGVKDAAQRYRLNHLDLVTPDGQPVRWAMNWMYRTRLDDTVCGPTLMLDVCRAAAEQQVPIFLYGNHQPVLDLLEARLTGRFPSLTIAGSQPSKFRRTTPEEKAATVERVKSSGAQITFVGLGCPRQEVFAYEYREPLGMPVIAVGAAFDYLAGTIREGPRLLHRMGLRWFYRWLQEPRRLFKRYTVVNAGYAGRLLLQILKVYRPDPAVGSEPPGWEVLYG